MTTYTFTGTATDSTGLSTSFNGNFTTTPVNQPPVISSVTVSPADAPPGTPRTITVVASDPESQTLTYTLTVNGVAQPSNTTGVFTVVV